MLEGLFGIAAAAADDTSTRYRPVRALGRGAMGRVELAEDPALGRLVALKTLAPERTADARARERIKREAFSLGQIDHRAVVGIHDVLDRDGEITLVMEYVEGPTLRQWLAESRPPRDIVRVLATVAAGIAAAHDRGIVHRDLKPENIVVQEGMHAKVIDFGLASRPEAQTESMGSVDEAINPSVTQTGAVLGTPAYMAPEQFLGGEVDARSDQFAFCVLAWESLAGARPFAGSTAEQVALHAAQGAVDPDTVSKVPRRFRSVLRTGLAADPAARHRDMRPLVAALTLAGPRLGWVVGGILGTAGLAAVAMVSQPDLEGPSQPDDAAAPDPCADAAAPIRQTWNDDRAQSLRDTISSSVTYGDAVADRLVLAVDAWAQDWSALAVSSCAAAKVHTTRTTVQAQADLRCLTAARQELDAALAGIAKVESSRLGRVLGTVDRVPSPARCGRAAFVDEVFGQVPSEAMTRAREANNDAQLHLASGDYTAALVAAQRAREALTAGEALALDAELNVSLARAHFQLGHSDLADRAYLDAANAAESSAYDELAATIWIELARVASVQRVNAERAQFYVERADAAVKRLGNPARLRAVVEQRQAQQEIAAGRADEALVHLARAKTLSQGQPWAERLRPAIAMDVGRVHYSRAQYTEAAAVFDEAITLYIAAYGPDHPAVADARHNLGSILVAAGRLDEALPILETALAARKRAYGEQHEKVARTQNSIATIAFTRGDYAAALQGYQSVVELHRVARDGPHVAIASAIANVGRAHAGLEEFDAADAAFAQACTMLTALVGDQHPRFAEAMGGRASALAAAGNAEQAKVLYRKVLAIRTETLGARTPRTLRTQLDLANVERQSGEPRAARAHLDDILKTEGLSPSLIAQAQLSLGWVDVDLRDVAQARTHFIDGLATRRRAGDDDQLDTAAQRVQRWLAANPQ